MKRNSLSTKLFAMLLCVVMVIGCLPLSVFASDWEGDIDLAPEGLNPENPIFLDLIYRWDNEEAQEGLQVMYYITDAEFDPTYFVAYGMPGQYTFSVTGEGDFSVTIDGEEIAAVDGVASKEITLSKGAGFNFAVSAGEGYYIDFQPVAGEPVIPVGADFDNAAILVEGANEATTLLSRQGEGMYYYKWTAPSDGVLTLSFNSYASNAVFANVEVQYPVFVGMTEFDDGTMEIDVTEGTEYGLIVLVVTDDRSTSEFSIQADFAETPTGPIVDSKLKFYTIGLSFAEEIGVQPMVLASVVKNYDSFYVEAVHTTATESTTITMTPAVSASSYTAYSLPMYARSMTDSVSFTLYAVKDGVTYCSETVNTSITQLALDKIGEYKASGKTAICKVLVDMLVYGAKVQEGFGYKTDDVPTNYLGEYASLGSDTTVAPVIGGTVETSGNGFKAGANSISMKDRVEIQFAFKVSQVEGCELRYVLDGKTYTIDASAFDTESLSGYAVACIALKPRHFRDQMTMGLYNIETGEAVSLVYTASVENYAAKTLAKYPELMPAIMNYGDSVLAAYPNG